MVGNFRTIYYKKIQQRKFDYRRWDCNDNKCILEELSYLHSEILIHIEILKLVSFYFLANILLTNNNDLSSVSWS